MTKEDIDKLENGVYVIHWLTGGLSVAAVGRDAHGNVWLMPSNWISGPRSDYWSRVDRVRQITTQERERMK